MTEFHKTALPELLVDTANNLPRQVISTTIYGQKPATHRGSSWDGRHRR